MRVAFEVIDRNILNFASLLSISLDGSQHEAALRGYSESLILVASILLGVSMKTDSDIKKDVLEELL